MEPANNLGFNKARQLTHTQQEFLDDLQHSQEVVKLMQEGKFENQSAKELDELIQLVMIK